MLKGKAQNVFKKINNMDKKTAYTWGAIIIVFIVAVMTMTAFMDGPEDGKFEGFETRGYDLAAMPFVSDEAEAYLLAHKYPDMKDNGVTALYSAQEKEARQEADAAAEQEAAETATDAGGADSYAGTGGGSSSGRYYGSGGGRTGGASRTEVGKLGSASINRGSGSGVTSSYNPGGDFRNFRDQNKGSERPFITPPPSQANAQRALARFQQGSRIAAGGRDSAAARKALIGGDVKGNPQWGKGDGVALDGMKGLNLAPESSSADVGGLDQALDEANEEGVKKNEENKPEEKESFLQGLVNGLVDIGLEMGKQFLSNKMNEASANRQYERQLQRNIELNGGKSWDKKEAKNLGFKNKSEWYNEQFKGLSETQQKTILGSVNTSGGNMWGNFGGPYGLRTGSQQQPGPNP